MKLGVGGVVLDPHGSEKVAWYILRMSFQLTFTYINMNDFGGWCVQASNSMDLIQSQ